MLQFSSSQFSNLRWRYFVESLLLKSTPNVSSVVLSSARVAGVDRADARASSVAREPPRGFFGETAALRVAGLEKQSVSPDTATKRNAPPCAWHGVLVRVSYAFVVPLQARTRAFSACGGS